MDENAIERVVNEWHNAESDPPREGKGADELFELQTVVSTLPDFEAWVVGASGSETHLLGLKSGRMYCLRRAEHNGTRGFETLFAKSEDVRVTRFDSLQNVRCPAPGLREAQHTRVWTFTAPEGWSVNVTTERSTRGEDWPRDEDACRQLAARVG